MWWCNRIFDRDDDGGRWSTSIWVNRRLVLNSGNGNRRRSGAFGAYVSDDVDDGDDENGQEECSQSYIRLSVFLCMVYLFEDFFVRCRSHDLMRLEASGNRNLARFR